MAIHGTLTTMSVSDLLQFLAVGRKTGTLKFSHNKVVKGIYFENGAIVGSSTNDPKEYLGQVLIHYGKLNEAQLQAAMEMQDDPLPADFMRVDVEPTLVIMEGIYRADELMRYRTLIPSDRTVMELGSGWTSTLSVGKEIRQILYFVEKRMSVAEICYNMHASAFDVYARLYDLINKGLAVVAGELPEIPDPVSEMPNLPEVASELLLLARSELTSDDTERALSIIHTVLRREPKNSAAQTLLLEAESKYIRQVFSKLSPNAVPRMLVKTEDLSDKVLGPQEGFVLSRINGEWDIQSILSICPFREADSLRMIQALLDSGIIGF